MGATRVTTPGTGGWANLKQWGLFYLPGYPFIAMSQFLKPSVYQEILALFTGLPYCRQPLSDFCNIWMIRKGTKLHRRSLPNETTHITRNKEVGSIHQHKNNIQYNKCLINTIKAIKMGTFFEDGSGNLKHCSWRNAIAFVAGLKSDGGCSCGGIDSSSKEGCWGCHVD